MLNPKEIFPNPLIGTWRLKNWKHIQNGGKEYCPWQKYSGALVYTAEGYVTAAIMKKERRLFDTSGFFSGTPKEKEDAFETFISYFGSYRIEKNNVVIHRIEMSLFPNWIGTEQTRYFQCKDNELILTTAEFETTTGEVEKAILTWKKVEPPTGLPL